MNKVDDKAWSPYLAGSLSGVVIILSAVFTGNFFGASTSFVRTAGMIEKFFSPERLNQLAYFRWFVPKIDWQWMFVVGIFCGSLLAAVTSGTYHWQALPDLWQKRFGPSRLKRGIIAFLGGIITMYGARFAGGCPSGHGMSGVPQLAISGLVSLCCFFIGGIIIAISLYMFGDKKR